jgi:serine/threonine protein kinase
MDLFSRSSTRPIDTQHVTTVDETHFDLISVLGRGSFAQLILARHIPTGILMSLRVTSRRKASTTKRFQDLIKERSILKNLSHRFLLSLYFCWFDNDNICMALPFCEGTDVWHFIWRSNRKHFDVKLSRFYLAEMICAVSVLHEHNLVHLDLKLENVLVHSSGHIKLCDFTFVQKVGAVMKYPLGTPGFEAPEVHLKRPLSPETDVFSLGVTIFVGITYELPFGKDVDYESALSSRRVVNESDKLKRYCGTGGDAEHLRQLLIKMMEPDEYKRVKMSQIRQHPFWGDMNWDDANAGKLKPPLRPQEGAWKTMNHYPNVTMRLNKSRKKPRLTMTKTQYAMFMRCNTRNVYLTPSAEYEMIHSYDMLAHPDLVTSTSGRRHSRSKSSMTGLGCDVSVSGTGASTTDGSSDGTSVTASPQIGTRRARVMATPKELSVTSRSHIRVPFPPSPSCNSEADDDVTSVNLREVQFSNTKESHTYKPSLKTTTALAAVTTTHTRVFENYLELLSDR